jgi:hypothetical protein
LQSDVHGLEIARDPLIRRFTPPLFKLAFSLGHIEFSQISLIEDDSVNRKGVNELIERKHP